MLLILLGITILYVTLIGSFIFGFDKVASFEMTDVEAKHKFSVVIPFRNESENLNALLASLARLNYPKDKFEVLFVNDASEDNSEEVIHSFFKKKNQKRNFNYSILQNIQQSNAPKKDAITLAIATSKFDWIVTTDADCTVPEFWLDVIDAFIQQKKCDMLVMPVGYQELNTFLKRFQALDMLSLQGSTIGAFGIKKPFMCNGANFAYKKGLFKKVDGFKNNNHMASGDDIFLLEKFLKQKKTSVKYLKNKKTLMFTKPEDSFKLLVAQRKRWASKTGGYNNLFGKLTAILVFIMNGALVCSPLLFFAHLISLKAFLYFWLIKVSIDFLLLFKTSRFFEQESLLSSYFFSSLLYPFFNVYIAITLVFSNYKWKGRQYKR
ncbi:MAG: glycosyltransferase [Bacteroidota bacterium]